MSRHDPRTAHEAHGRELAELLDAVLAGELVTNREAVERQVVRVVGAQLRLHRRHRVVDERGRCRFCWTAPTWRRPWPRRIPCTVNNALGFYLHQPEWFVLPVIAGKVALLGGRS